MALSRNHCILVVKEGVPVKVKEEVLLTLMSLDICILMEF
jgi:hypothetical protein